jgi:hypothetical protein
MNKFKQWFVYNWINNYIQILGLLIVFTILLIFYGKSPIWVTLIPICGIIGTSYFGCYVSYTNYIKNIKE